MDIIIGEIINPKISPNFIQRYLNGVSNFELIIPNIKKRIEKGIAQILIGCPLIIGQKAISAKTKKNKNPKLLF
tara:strand:- start:2545 stop:2766 length:222 start_codon:yes stop_codon:yes gene_type:complete